MTTNLPIPMKQFLAVAAIFGTLAFASCKSVDTNSGMTEAEVAHSVTLDISGMT